MSLSLSLTPIISFLNVLAFLAKTGFRFLIMSFISFILLFDYYSYCGNVGWSWTKYLIVSYSEEYCHKPYKVMLNYVKEKRKKKEKNYSGLFPYIISWPMCSFSDHVYQGTCLCKRRESRVSYWKNYFKHSECRPEGSASRLWIRMNSPDCLGKFWCM